jgi:thiol-disulfide isomerase/thioredoxin
MIDLIIADKKDVVSAERAETSTPSGEILSLPKFQVTDLAGHPLTSDQLAGRAFLVEFWATWCPPCRSTLWWLGELKRKYGDNLAVVALAVESPDDQIRSTVKSLSPDLGWAISDAPTGVRLWRHHLCPNHVPVRPLRKICTRPLRRSTRSP